MVDEEEVARDAAHVGEGLDVRVVVEVRVDRRDEARDLRPHAALARERHVLDAVLDEPLEERDVKPEARREPVAENRGRARRDWDSHEHPAKTTLLS